MCSVICCGRNESRQQVFKRKKTVTGLSAEGQATAGGIGGTLEAQVRRWAGTVM